jgi:quinoprotein relay system zinc metallohydrolase 2
MRLSRRSVLATFAAGAALPVLRTIPVAAAAATVQEVAPGVWVHQGLHALFDPQNAGDISNPGFVVGSDAVAVIDTGGSPVIGRSLREAIKAITTLPVRYVINTHMHPDHVFGNAAFEDDKPEFAAHHKMGRGLAARAERYLAINKESLGDAAFAGTKLIPPTRPVTDRETIDLGGRKLTLVAHPTAHTDNDLTVLDEQTGTLFMGDVLFAGHVPTIDGSIRGWLKLLEKLAGEKYERIVPGHGPASMAWPVAADPIRRYLNAIATDVRMLIKQGKTLEDATASAAVAEKDAWVLFDEYHKRNVSAAFAELEWE